MAVESRAERISVEEYLKRERAGEIRHEFVDGYMYAMAGGTRYHSRLAIAMIRALGQQLNAGRCLVFNSDAQVRIGDRYFYPDVTVSCDKRDAGEGDDIRYPTVIVEVPSPSTEAYDRGDKFDLYQECATLQEYVLISVRRPEIQVYRRTGEGWMLRTCRSGDELKLSSLEVRIAVDEIYERIVMPRERQWLHPTETTDRSG